MKCRYCNIALAPLRSLADGEFCCDEHRLAYTEQGGAELASPPPPEGGLVALHARMESVLGEPLAPDLKPPVPLDFRPKTMAAPAFSATGDAQAAKGWLRVADRLIALKFGAQLFNTPAKKVAQATGEPQFPTTPVLPGAQVDPISAPAALPEWFESAEDVPEEPREPRFQRMTMEAERSWR